MCCTGVMKDLCDGNKNRIKRCCDGSECERLKDGFLSNKIDRTNSAHIGDEIMPLGKNMPLSLL